MALEHIKSLIFGRPLLVAPGKLDAIVGGLAVRLGLPPAPKQAIGPESEFKRPGVYSVDAETGVATVQVVGTLMDRLPLGLDDEPDGATDAKSSGLAGYRAIAADLDRALADPRVEGILLEVDSYGGEAFGLFDVADKIHAARSSKPIYAVASQKAMSAGYAVLSQADRVFVPQAGEVGSIGVLCTHVDQTAADAKDGYRVTHIHAGARKVDLSPHVSLSPEAKARLEAEVDQVYETFVAAVVRGRGLTAEAVKATEAGCYIGQKAVDAGLADEVGDVGTARAALAATIEEKRRTMKELEQARAEINRLQALDASRAKELEVLRSTLQEREKALEQFKADATSRKSKELDGVVDQLDRDLVAGGATALEKTQRDKIRAALDVNEDLGRELVAATKDARLAVVGRGAVAGKKNLDPAKSEAEEKRQKFVAGVGAPASAKKED